MPYRPKRETGIGPSGPMYFWFGASPSPASSMASASLPHQGRFAPLRGAQAGILDPSASPPPCRYAGTGRGTGLFTVRTRNMLRKGREPPFVCEEEFGAFYAITDYQ